MSHSFPVVSHPSHPLSLLTFSPTVPHSLASFLVSFVPYGVNEGPEGRGNDGRDGRLDEDKRVSERQRRSRTITPKRRKRKVKGIGCQFYPRSFVTPSHVLSSLTPYHSLGSSSVRILSFHSPHEVNGVNEERVSGVSEVRWTKGEGSDEE